MGKQFTNTLYWSGDFIMVFDEMMYMLQFNREVRYRMDS